MNCRLNLMELKFKKKQLKTNEQLKNNVEGLE
jgi:hypothetical protein